LDWRGWLWMIEFNQGLSQGNSFFPIDEDSASAAEDMTCLMILTFSNRAPLCMLGFPVSLPR
jgi:hypothetical protein